MANTKLTILHSDRGSVFSVFSEEELKQMTESSERKIAVCGRINNSGIVEVPKGATLSDIIELCGGILDKKEFSFFGEKFKTGSVKCNNIPRKSVIEDSSPMNNSKMFCLRHRNKLNTNVNFNDRLLKYNILKRSHNHINRVLH